MSALEKLAKILKDKKFIKTDDPETKVMLVKGGTGDSIEIGLSDYCAKEYAQALLDAGLVFTSITELDEDALIDLCVQIHDYLEHGKMGHAITCLKNSINRLKEKRS